MRDVGILGGGISGLFTGYFLGGDVEILEGDEQTGGLARCFGGEGFRLVEQGVGNLDGRLHAAILPYRRYGSMGWRLNE